MILTEETKELIRKEYEEFKDFMYAGKSKEERDELAQFFTPPEISIKLLEAYDVDTLAGKVIRDPTSGSGNLLAACLIAGADSDKIFGNDYDSNMVSLCRNRLNKVCDMLGKPHIKDWQIHVGNALQKRCLIEFGTDYESNYNIEYIDDLEYAQSYEHTKEEIFFGQTITYHINKISWAEENRLAKIRYNQKQQKEGTKKTRQNSSYKSDYACSLFRDELTPEQEEFLREVD